MKHIYPRIIIYILLLTSTLLLPTHLPNQHYVAIFKPSTQVGKFIQANEPPLSGSFVLASQVQPIVVATVPTPVVATISSTASNCGSDPYMAFIYQHESGCSTSAINASSGSCGLGQALPCSKMGCSLSDWTCQDNYFRSYAISVYGSTYNAMLAWQSKSWW